MPQPVRVIYIMGAGRSGSTVLDTALSAHADVFGAGELVHLFRAEALQRANCGCGEPRDVCPVWSQVRNEWTRLTGEDDIHSHAALLRRFTSVSRGGLLQWHRLGQSPSPDSNSPFRKCLDQTRATYEAIARTSGCRAIVDSSKNPLRARLLCQTPGLDVRLIHLVRDPRGVAWSRMKALQPSRESGIPRVISARPVHVSAGYWRFMNQLSERVCRRHPDVPAIRVRYEDFVAQPATVLAAIGEICDIDFGDVSRQIESGISLIPGHPYAGNRVRNSGPLILKSDTAWHENLTRHQQTAIALMAGGQMLRYGYLDDCGSGMRRSA